LSAVLVFRNSSRARETVSGHRETARSRFAARRVGIQFAVLLLGLSGRARQAVSVISPAASPWAASGPRILSAVFLFGNSSRARKAVSGHRETARSRFAARHKRVFKSQAVLLLGNSGRARHAVCIVGTAAELGAARGSGILLTVLLFGNPLFAAKA